MRGLAGLGVEKTAIAQHVDSHEPQEDARSPQRCTRWRKKETGPFATVDATT